MAGRLEGKVCVITGAGGGMGADAAQLFTEEGAKVVVADVNGDAAGTVADEVGGLAVQVDVSDAESVQAMYAAAAKHFVVIADSSKPVTSLHAPVPQMQAARHPPAQWLTPLQGARSCDRSSARS